MFYRVTTYEFEPGLEGDIAAWADTKTAEVRAIEGLIAADAYNTSPGRGVIVAAYENETAFEAAAGTIAAVLGDLRRFLNGPPATMSGLPFWTTREDVPAAM